MKRKMMWLLVTVLMVASFAGCGKEDVKEVTTVASTEEKETEAAQVAPRDNVVLTLGIWDTNQEAALQETLDAFNAMHPDIEAVIELTPWDNYWTKLDAAAMAGLTTDVFWMNIYMPKYVNGGVLKALDGYIEKDAVDMSAYVEDVTAIYNFKGEQWGMPKGVDAITVLYNKAIFDKYGVAYPAEDWTYEDMVAIATELKAKIDEAGGDEYALGMSPYSQDGYFNYIFQNGGEIISEDGMTSGFNQEGNQEAFRKMIHLYETGLSAPYEVLANYDTNASALFASGKIAMSYVGSWMMPVLENSPLSADGNFGIVEMPSQNGTRTSVMNGLAYCMSSQTKHPDEAWELIKFLTGEEGNKIQGVAGIDIPALTSAQHYYGEAYKNLEVAPIFSAIETGRRYPTGETVARWSPVMEDYVARMLGGAISVEEGCAAIFEEMQGIIDSAK